LSAGSDKDKSDDEDYMALTWHAHSEPTDAGETEPEDAVSTQDSEYLSLKVMADADHEVSTTLIKALSALLTLSFSQPT
jgi:hypothetical protein